MEIVLKITHVLPVQEGVSKTGNSWKVASFVGETQEQYPRKVYFEIFGEKRISENPCNVDDVVTVSFDIESREFSGRWYTTVRAWRVAKEAREEQKDDFTSPNNLLPGEAPASAPAPESAPVDGENNDGLPF